MPTGRKIFMPSTKQVGTDKRPAWVPVVQLLGDDGKPVMFLGSGPSKWFPTEEQAESVAKRQCATFDLSLRRICLSCGFSEDGT